MNIMHIVGALVATVAVTAVFYAVASSRSRRTEVSASEFADTSLALLFLTAFIATFGWFANAMMSLFDNVIVGVAVTGAVYAVTLAATIHLMKRWWSAGDRENARVRQ